MDGDVPRRASYGVYISQLIRFANVCNHVADFNGRNKCLTAKFLQQGYRYHLNDLPVKFSVCVNEGQDKLPTMYWLQSFTKDHTKVQVGKDQEKAQSEKDSHSKNRGGKKPN